ncbi:hypothetical protein, partial [Tannerella forsythia]|uniref:hypothetical protein n=1 Tax=Tannerella forsythia TaxID=28112 RepID=UPI001B86690E
GRGSPVRCVIRSGVRPSMMPDWTMSVSLSVRSNKLENETAFIGGSMSFMQKQFKKFIRKPIRLT